MKTLGLIGGTSWHSTIEYYRGINKGVSQVIGQASNPELILYSINIDVMRAQIREDINAKYLEVALKLQKSGAEAIVICANTPHMAIDFVQPKIDIPFLHIGDAVGQEAKKKHLQKLALFGNKPTMTKAFMTSYLMQNYDLEIITPEGEDLMKSHYFVSRELTQGQFTDEAKSFYQNQLQTMTSRGVEGAILGCTELPMLLRQEKIDMPLISTTDLHIQMAVDFIMSP